MRGRPAARWLLVGIILAIGLGPRIRLPGLLDRAVDLRVQDMLLVVALVYLGRRLPPLRVVWGPWLLIFVFTATVAVTARLLLTPEIPVLRTLAYFGRGVEPFLLAAAVAGLYRLCGRNSERIALRALLVTVFANGLWVGYQYATGTQQTLIGTTVADQLVAYGPRLVGEGSAFGAGYFFVFATALGVAAHRRPDISRRLSVSIMVLGVVGTYLSGSRLSLGCAAVCLAVVVLSPRVGGKPNVLAAIVVSIAAILLIPRVPEAGRLSAAGVTDGLTDRVQGIWDPLIDILNANLLWGIGPGRLGTSEYPWTEAHNVLLRAGLDYGIVIGSVFLLIFLTAMVRGCRDATSPSTTPERHLWGGLVALAIVGAFLGGMVQETLFVVMSTHLIMLAVGLFAGSRLGPLPDPRRKPTHLEIHVQTARRHVSKATQ